MTGKEFLRRIKALAKARKLEIFWDPKQGKGSHGTLYLGEHRTTVKHGEIGRGLLARMLTQLGLSRDDIEEE